MYVRAELRRPALQLLQQLSVAGVRQEATGPRVGLQLLQHVGHGEGVHHLLLWGGNRTLIHRESTPKSSRGGRIEARVFRLPAKSFWVSIPNVLGLPISILTLTMHSPKRHYSCIVGLLCFSPELVRKVAEHLPASRASMFCSPSFSCWLLGSCLIPSWYVVLASSNRPRNSSAAAFRE